ncbi:STM4015 family protein [Rhodococcus sp. IEGM 1379]|uniref:STM4015 family protein n=1 Tax=Rhodococcus sp. IEGM 1379 TaxID=3047086 RepID=UPI0024B832AD|nr:STM4015 family protein [Rhodococcus sp. IEGM 1379]MDI9917778.1 STM4015 family protein [Rhodococcus sp. IEGM 1379]
MVVTHLGALRGLPAFDFPNPAASCGALPGADAVAWRISVEPYADDAEEFADAWARFVETVDLSAVQALIIGQWGKLYEVDSSSIVELIVGQQERLTSLRALILADITQGQQETSWIQQSDVTPILAAFPRLVELGIRGGTELQFPPAGHACLRRLTIESGGLPVDVVRGISFSEFPALESLELWLGDDGYGGDTTAEDLSVLLRGESLPSLKHLGLRNSEIQDAVVHAVVAAPLLARLRTLDLSLGVFTDDGAAAFLASRRFAHLDSLDLHHHFLSDAVVADLTRHCAELAVHVDLSEQMSPDAYDGEVWRCVAFSE